MSVLKKITITSLVFLIPPGMVYSLNWQWSPDSLNRGAYYFLLITETAGNPWSILTSIFFLVLFFWLSGIRIFSHAVIMVVIIASALCFGQVIKLIIKNYGQQPRPYLVWLKKNSQISEVTSYQNSLDHRHFPINRDRLDGSIPDWLSTYWQQKAGSYSFPSGHTIFSVTWALLAIVFIGYARAYLLLIMMAVWVLLVEVSRLLLAVHDARDIFVAVLIAYILSLSVYFCTKRWPIVKCLRS